MTDAEYRARIIDKIQVLGSRELDAVGEAIGFRRGLMHPRELRVDAAISKQLQFSIALNGRMKTRLRKLYDHRSCPVDVARALADIMNDQEPAWNPDAL